MREFTRKTRDNTHTRTVSIKDACTPQKIEIRIILTDILSHPYIFYIFPFNFQLTQRMRKSLWGSFVTSICVLAILAAYSLVTLGSSVWVLLDRLQNFCTCYFRFYLLLIIGLTAESQTERRSILFLNGQHVQS